MNNCNSPDWLNSLKDKPLIDLQMKLEITQEKVLEAASKCPQAKETLKTLFPEVFKEAMTTEQKVEILSALPVEHLTSVTIMCSVALSCGDFGEIQEAREIAKLYNEAKEFKQALLLKGYDEQELTPL